MNRNFKVVFSKARGALMVVNEATSSVQAKGTKTVIAAAVAALSLGAGVASAADSQTFDNVQLNANTTLTITKGESGLIYTPTGTVTGTVGSETDQTFAAKGDSLNSTQGQEADVILNGGDFAVDASGASEAMEVTVGQLGIQKATQEGEKDVGTGAGNITLTANSVAAKETPVALTLNASSIDLQAGTIAFKAGEKANQGAITLNSTGDIVLGTAQSSKQFGAVTETTPAVDRNIIVDAGLEATISATDANFNYNAGTVTNAGSLTLKATKVNDDTAGVVTLGKDVSFANSGTLAIEGDKVELNASYDATSEANKSGYLAVKSTAASDGTITVGGTLTADTIKLGEKTPDADGKRQEKNQIVLNADTTTVAKDGKLDVKNTLTLENDLTVLGMVNAAATDVKAKDVAVNIEASDAADNKYAGSVSLGKVTVGVGTADQANSLTVSVANGASAQADSLDIAAEDKDKNKAGEFALVAGKFNAGTLTNGGSVSIGDTGNGTASTVGTLTVSGTSVNKGTVTFSTAVGNTQNALVIAADSTFSNEGNLGADSGTTGDITVAGTLTNVLKAASGTDAGITGKINANAVNVEEGGVVNAALDDNYKVTTTNVAGTFATTLNAKTLASNKTNDALELKSAFVVNGGAITDGTNEVTSYVIGGDKGSLTLNSDKKLTSVLTNQTTAADGAFTVGSAASVEVGTLTLTKGHALVEGDLTVTTALNTATDGTIKVSDGDLSVSSLDVLGLEIKNGEIAEKTASAGTTVPSVAAGTITLEKASTFNLDLGEVTFANKDKLSALTGLVADNADGLINVGNVTITGLISDKNEITYDELKALNGLTTDAIKQVTVTGADAIDRTISVGNLKIAGNTTTGASSIEDGKTVTLNGSGMLVYYDKPTTLADGSILYIDNAANGQKFLLSKANGTSYSADAVFEGNLLMEESYNKDSNTLSIGMTDKSEVVDKLGDVAGLDAIYGMYEKGENVGNDNAKFFRDLMSSQTSSAYDKTTGEWNFQTIRTTLNDVAAIGATTGAQAVTMDAVNQMADTVAARTSILTQRAQGVNVWVDVNGGRFEGKKVMDGAGYSSDIYAGTLGADYQFANGAVLGAALTIGTADTDSKGTTAKTSMDSDLVGFSVYGSKTFADIWNVAGDIGYLQASNDVTESGYGFGDFSEDVNAFTLGVRGEVLTKAGSVNIVPHLGLRYTRLSTDGFTAGFNTEIDDQNIFQMPVGVTVSADFETSGWTIAPKFDLSVVPTFGDKDADLKLGITGVSASDDLSVRVIDSNPVQATLGVSATNGAWGFGLNYKLGVGSDDRMNNSFNANVRYAF